MEEKNYGVRTVRIFVCVAIVVAIAGGIFLGEYLFQKPFLGGLGAVLATLLSFRISELKAIFWFR